MNMQYQNAKIDLDLNAYIRMALSEDIQEGDHSSLSSIPYNSMGKGKCLVKADGVLAGVELAKRIYKIVDPTLKIKVLKKDGAKVKYGDIAFYVEGRDQSILTGERLVLNFMQRMSGIATLTNQFVAKCKGSKTKVLDTRKTTPGLRYFEKWAVRIGGGTNHRFGLYDMIMLKDNHVDYAGGIKQAIMGANQYLKEKSLKIKIEIETRNLDEVKQVLKVGKVDRIMLDNFTPDEIVTALKVIKGKFETEASGGITLDTISAYAKTGVDYISVGALTHSYHSMDISLKAVK